MQQRLLIKCFSLLLLGMFLATLATLNFSLAFLIGILSFPLSFLGVPSPASSPEGEHAGYLETKFLYRAVSNLVLHILSPPMVFCAICYVAGINVQDVLIEAAFGWRVWGLWTQVVFWCIWWPAWLVGTVFVSVSL